MFLLPFESIKGKMLLFLLNNQDLFLRIHKNLFNSNMKYRMVNSILRSKFKKLLIGLIFSLVIFIHLN
jgi:hypothetical protein